MRVPHRRELTPGATSDDIFILPPSYEKFFFFFFPPLRELNDFAKKFFDPRHLPGRKKLRRQL